MLYSVYYRILSVSMLTTANTDVDANTDDNTKKILDINQFVDTLVYDELDDNPHAVDIFTKMVNNDSIAAKYNNTFILLKDKNYCIMKHNSKYHINGKMYIPYHVDIISNITTDCDTFSVIISGKILPLTILQNMHIPVIATPYTRVEYSIVYDAISDIPDEIYVTYTGYTLSNSLRSSILKANMITDTIRSVAYGKGIMTIF